MPVVVLKMLEGRTLEQKKAVCKRISDVICEEVNATPENVTVIIEEMKKEDYFNNGVQYCDK